MVLITFCVVITFWHFALLHSTMENQSISETAVTVNTNDKTKNENKDSESNTKKKGGKSEEKQGEGEGEKSGEENESDGKEGEDGPKDKEVEKVELIYKELSEECREDVNIICKRNMRCGRPTKNKRGPTICCLGINEICNEDRDCCYGSTCMGSCYVKLHSNPLASLLSSKSRLQK